MQLKIYELGLPGVEAFREHLAAMLSADDYITTARRLGISRVTLASWMVALDLKVERKRVVTGR